MDITSNNNNNENGGDRPWNSGPVFPQLAGRSKPEAAVPEGEDGEAQAATKKRRKTTKLDVQLLTRPEGLPWLYENGKKLKFSSSNQRENLKTILSFYQIWAHQLDRSLNFKDFVQKAEKLTKQGIIKQYMSGWKENGNNYNPDKLSGIDGDVNDIEGGSYGLERLNLDSMFPTYNNNDFGYGAGTGFEVEDAPIDFDDNNNNDMQLDQPPSPASSVSVNFPDLGDLIKDNIQPSGVSSANQATGEDNAESEDEGEMLTDEQLAIIDANRLKAMERLAARKRMLEEQELNGL
ncbi:hypothetical protein CONCODRAFT_72655 [Conidiobolus coronatus NRRL 28638]|uniref:Chromosome segregation in meiosis protein n=1 Tax=Conidiobolus coronatus (strain ATCC 28846 / CBS 209.66 / NRRL 28638) TaxID=796925 RepID=A0A137NYN4_CONC2|nr:hypothetical protein CONCODRAFT_72655 [Conidiobolus coronatus NRRL 28638]|eukprot:KXN67867.1 hypothetical protein CONCODRAFT_72655 [Conidiobolus coronatus NRRL 28638]